MSEPEDLPNFLTNPEALNWAIAMFENQVNGNKISKAKLQKDLKAVDESISDLENKLKILRGYKKFMEFKGFSTMKQTVEAHQDEMEQAEKDRVVEQPSFDLEELMRNFGNNNNSFRYRWNPS